MVPGLGATKTEVLLSGIFELLGRQCPMQISSIPVPGKDGWISLGGVWKIKTHVMMAELSLETQRERLLTKLTDHNFVNGINPPCLGCLGSK